MPSPPPLLPPDAEPLPEQPAAAPTRPDTTIIAAGTVTNRRMSLIGTSIVVDGETDVAAFRFPAMWCGNGHVSYS
jgi:hypothetical protein